MFTLQYSNIAINIGKMGPFENVPFLKPPINHGFPMVKWVYVSNIHPGRRPRSGKTALEQQREGTVQGPDDGAEADGGMKKNGKLVRNLEGKCC